MELSWYESILQNALVPSTPILLRTRSNKTFPKHRPYFTKTWKMIAT